jgi:hypothetical protein
MGDLTLLPAHMQVFNRFANLCIALLIAFTSPSFASTLEEMVRMADQLDLLDKADFDDLVRNAVGCTKRRDFNCAEAGLTKAAKLAKDNRDRTTLAQAREGIGKERELLRQEIEAERAAELRRKQEMEAQVAQAEREGECEKFCETQAGVSACYRGQIAPWSCPDYETRSAGGPNYGAAILQGFNQTLQSHARITSIHNQAMANLQSSYAERDRQRQLQQENLRAQQAQQAKAAQERRTAQQTARERESPAQGAGSSSRASSGGGSVAARDDRTGTAQRDQAAEQRRKDEQDARERRAQEQKEQEDKKQRQLAERQAQREAEAAEQARSKATYLAQMQSGIRLTARQCFGGQYVVGTRPRIKPEVLSCVDVHYRAQCTNAANNQFIDGVGRTFVGMGTDCFSGDNYAIEPKLSCDVKDIQVTLKEVRECNE